MPGKMAGMSIDPAGPPRGHLILPLIVPIDNARVRPFGAHFNLKTFRITVKGALFSAGAGKNRLFIIALTISHY
jgi:hypothetical protein